MTSVDQSEAILMQEMLRVVAAWLYIVQCVSDAGLPWHSYKRHVTSGDNIYDENEDTPVSTSFSNHWDNFLKIWGSHFAI